MPNTKIRILQFVNTLEFGGATDYALTLTENIDTDRFETYFAYGPGSGWEDRAGACSVELLYLDTMKPTHTAESENTVIGDLVALWRLYRFLKTRKIQVIHTHGSKSRLMGGLAAVIARVPVRIQSAHGFAFNSRQPRWKNRVFVAVERLMGFLHHELVLESRYDLEEAKLRKLARSQRCIYTGIEFEDQDNVAVQTSLRTELNIAADAVVVTMVGRLTEQKDPHTFVKAAHIVHEQMKDVVFLIVGDGDLYDSTAALVGDSANIHLLGRRNDTDAILAITDIYMLCSRWEGIPLTILTAQFLGKPVIATNKLGLPEVVIDKVTGLLASEGDPEDYARAVLTLAADSSLRYQYGAHGAEAVKSRHSLPAMIREFEKLYTDANLR